MIKLKHADALRIPLCKEVKMMKAAIIEKFGTDESIHIKEKPVPSIQADDVLIQVKAAGINPIDWKTKMRHGVVDESALPYIPGWDVSGVITAVGANVRKFKVGDEVFGMLNFPKLGRTHAEYVVANPDDLAIKPSNISFEEAAGIPLAALTAWQALAQANIQPEQKILIHAAAGGVGHIAVQLAKLKSLYVIGTASENNFHTLKQLGVDQCIDYKQQQFDELVHDCDIVLDTMGGDVLTRSITILKPQGYLLTLLGHRYPELLTAAKKAHITPVAILVAPSGEQLQEMARLIENNQLKIIIDRVYPFAEINAAYQHLAQGHAKGKVVLTMTK